MRLRTAQWTLFGCIQRLYHGLFVFYMAQVQATANQQREALAALEKLHGRVRADRQVYRRISSLFSIVSFVNCFAGGQARPCFGGLISDHAGGAGYFACHEGYMFDSIVNVYAC